MTSIRTSVLFLIPLSLMPRAADAYETNGVWESDSITMKVSKWIYDDEPDYYAAIVDAVDVFNLNASNFYISLSVDNDSTTAEDNGESEIEFTSDSTLLCGDGCEHSTYDSDGTWMIESDIFLNASDMWELDNVKSDGKGYNGWRRPLAMTLLHELGHSAGLFHEESYYNLMGIEYTYVCANGNTIYPYVGEDATTGLRALYGSYTDYEDVSVSHWRLSGASGDYSTHARTRLWNSSGTLLSSTTVSGEPVYSVSRGQSVRMEYTFENNGAVNYSTVPFKVYWSTNNTISTADNLIGTWTFNNFNANTPYTNYITLTIPTTLTSGSTYWLGIILDSSGSISEVNEANNATYLTAIKVL